MNHTDTAMGKVWLKDTYYTGGNAYQDGSVTIKQNTDTAVIYQTE